MALEEWTGCMMQSRTTDRRLSGIMLLNWPMFWFVMAPLRSAVNALGADLNLCIVVWYE